jgi:hypothetical protein
MDPNILALEKGNLMERIVAEVETKNLLTVEWNKFTDSISVETMRAMIRAMIWGLNEFEVHINNTRDKTTLGKDLAGFLCTNCKNVDWDLYHRRGSSRSMTGRVTPQCKDATISALRDCGMDMNRGELDRGQRALVVVLAIALNRNDSRRVNCKC